MRLPRSARTTRSARFIAASNSSSAATRGSFRPRTSSCALASRSRRRISTIRARRRFESLLDVCLALGLTRKPLQWHYRSRREALIAFSNRYFYDGRLVTFPSAGGRHRARRHVSEGRRWTLQGRREPRRGAARGGARHRARATSSQEAAWESSPSASASRIGSSTSSRSFAARTRSSRSSSPRIATTRSSSRTWKTSRATSATSFSSASATGRTNRGRSPCGSAR